MKVELHEDRLSITGTRKAVTKVEGTQYHRDERSFGTFRRTLALPKSVDADKVDATYNDGVLLVRVPKIAKPQPRTVAIRTFTNDPAPKPVKRVAVQGFAEDSFEAQHA